MRRADLPPDRGGRAVVSEGASKRLSVGGHGLCVAVQHGLLGLGGGPLAGAPALLRLPRTRAEILVSGCRVNGRRSRSWPPRSQGARLDAATRAGQSRTDLWQSAPRWVAARRSGGFGLRGGWAASLHVPYLGDEQDEDGEMIMMAPPAARTSGMPNVAASGPAMAVPAGVSA